MLPPTYQVLRHVGLFLGGTRLYLPLSLLVIKTTAVPPFEQLHVVILRHICCCVLASRFTQPGKCNMKYLSISYIYFFFIMLLTPAYKNLHKV